MAAKDTFPNEVEAANFCAHLSANAASALGVSADITVRLDLHGSSVEETRKLITENFLKAKEINARALFIITGKGRHTNPNGQRGVLRKLVPGLLKPYEAGIESVKLQDGGYSVYLKRAAMPYDAVISRFKAAVADFTGSAYAENIRQQARQVNNASAMRDVGVAYLSGMYSELSPPELGMEYLEKSAALGSVDACAISGLVYMEGTYGVAADYKKAKRYLTEAATKGHIEGQYHLACFWLSGKGGYKNDTEGRRWMEAAARAKFVMAIEQLGMSYLAGDYTEQDAKKGVQLLIQSAKAGRAVSQRELARCYATGHGVNVPALQMAYLLYQKAAAQGDVYSLFQLGEYHLDDRVGKRDPAISFGYFMQAARYGDADAQTRLCQLLMHGEGVEKNVTEAFAWLQKAVDQKHAQALCLQAEYYENGLAGPEARAPRCWLPVLCLAARACDEVAIERAGLLLQASSDPWERKLLFTCLQRLMKQYDHRVAKAFVGYAYLRGIAVDKDAVKGMQLLDASAADDDSNGKPSPIVHYVKGQALREGLYGEARAQEWREHIACSANKGFSLAQAIVGFAMLNEAETEDKNDALKIIFMAGMNGDATALSFVIQNPHLFNRLM